MSPQRHVSILGTNEARQGLLALATNQGEHGGALFRPSAPALLFVLGLFAVAFLVYSLAWPQAPVMTPDSPTYMRLARDVKHLTLSRLQERTPGYPLFLIVNSAEDRPTRLLFYSSLMVHFASIGILAYLLTVLAVPRILTVVFLVISLLPPFVEPAAYVLTETLSQFLIVVACVSLVFWLVRQRNVFLGLFSVAALFAALVRPAFQALAPFLVLCALLCFIAGCTPLFSIWRLLIPLGIAVLIPLTGLTAWAYANYRKFGYFGTGTMGAITISHKTVSFLEELPDQYADIRDILLRYRDPELLQPFSDHTAQMTTWRAIGELRRHYGNDEAKMVSRLAEANWYLIKTKPLSYLAECMKSLGTYWLPNTLILSNAGSGKLKIVWAALQLGLLGFFMLQEVALGGLGLTWLSFAIWPSSHFVLSQHSRLLVCSYTVGSGMIVYTAIVSCFFGIGSPRFRTPTDLLMIATSMIGYVLWRNIRSLVISRAGIPARVQAI